MEIDDLDDWSEHFRDRPRPSRQPFDDEGVQETEVMGVDPERDLPGSTYRVPNSYWDIPGGTFHPGACAWCSIAKQIATFVKGTDVKSARSDITPTLIIQPSPLNGLSKPTAFALAPRPITLKKAVLLHYDRKMGILDPKDLAELRQRLSRLFDQERGRFDV